MSGPRRILLEAVQGALQRIRIADGYHTDIGLRVIVEPAPLKEEEAGDLVVVVWSRQERSSIPATQNIARLTTFQVIAKVPATLADSQERLDLMVDDIERAMADQQYRYPVGYRMPQYESAEPLAGKVSAGWIGVALTYTTHIPIRRPAA